MQIRDKVTGRLYEAKIIKGGEEFDNKPPTEYNTVFIRQIDRWLPLGRNKDRFVMVDVSHREKLDLMYGGYYFTNEENSVSLSLSKLLKSSPSDGVNAIRSALSEASSHFNNCCDPGTESYFDEILKAIG